MVLLRDVSRFTFTQESIYCTPWHEAIFTVRHAAEEICPMNSQLSGHGTNMPLASSAEAILVASMPNSSAILSGLLTVHATQGRPGGLLRRMWVAALNVCAEHKGLIK